MASFFFGLSGAASLVLALTLILTRTVVSDIQLQIVATLIVGGFNLLGISTILGRSK